MSGGGDSLTAAEQRCLKLVTIAEEQAKESQRELVKELTFAKNQLHEREELLSTSMEHLTHQMAVVVQDLKRTTDFFAQSHQETTHAIVHASQQRAAQESSAISNMRSNLHLFYKYGLFMRRRTLRDAFLTSIRHCSPLAIDVTMSAAGQLGLSSPLAHEVMERTGLRFDVSEISRRLHQPSIDEEVVGDGEENSVGASTRIAANASSSKHVTFEQFCEAYQNYRSVDHNEQLASRQVLSWRPSADDRQLLDFLLSGTVRRTALAVGSHLLDDGDDGISGSASSAPPFTCEDVLGVFQAVLVYICGATDLLDRLSSSLENQLLDHFRKFESFNRGLLLSGEREILKLHAERLMKEQVVEIVPRAVGVLLTQRIADACEERFTFAVEKLREVQQTLTESTHSNLKEANSRLVEAVLPLALEGFYVVAPSPTSSASSSIPSSPTRTQRDGKKFPAPTSSAALSVTPLRQPIQLATGGTINVAESSGQRMLADLQLLVKTAASLAPRMLAVLQDEHASAIKQAVHKFEVELRTLQREMLSKRELRIDQQVTVFRLPQLQSDVEHQQTMRRVLVDRLKYQERITTARIQQLELESSNLKRLLATQEKSLQEVSQARLHAEKELTMLHAIASERSSIHGIVLRAKEEVRCINYTLNAVTFGDGWQKSLLMLREQLHKQCAVEHSRVLGEISTVLRQRNASHHMVEQMLDARLAQILKSVNDDLRRRGEASAARLNVEMQAADDEHVNVVHELEEKHAKDLQTARAQYEAAFTEQLQSMNTLYEERTRRFHQRERELETYFELKIRQQREKFRRREVELEDRLEHRFQEMHKIFDIELNTIKGQFIEKERKLDRDRLLMEATLEKRVNERVIEQRKWTERVCQQLQDLTLSFVRQKQEELESFRETELANFNNFLRTGLNTARQTYNNLATDLERMTEARVLDAAVAFDKVLSNVKTEHKAEVQQREIDFSARLGRQKQLQEEVLRMTQLLRIEQDEAFWQSCFARLVSGEKTMQQKWSDVRLELQRRYSSIIDTCTDYLNRDIAGARRAFESELQVRTSQLHEYAHYYHRMQIVVEENLWEEILRRSYIEREEATEFASLKIFSLEERLKRQQLATVASYREPGIRTVTLDDLRRVRDKYETRILDQQVLASQLQRECIASVDIGLKASTDQLRLFEEVTQNRLDDIQKLLCEKAEAFHQGRAKAASDSLAQLLLTTESSLYDSRRVEDASFFKTVLSTVKRQQRDTTMMTSIDSPGTVRRNRGASSPERTPQRRAHSAGSGKQNLSTTATSPNANTNKPIPLGDAMHHHQIMTPSQPPQAPAGSVAGPGGSVASVADPLSSLTFHDPRMVQYFASMSSVVSSSAERFHSNVEQKFSEYEKRRKDLFQHVHEEYVEATSALMQRLDIVHGEKSVAEATAAQQAAMLKAQQDETASCLALLRSEKSFQQPSHLAHASGMPFVSLPKSVVDEVASLRERVLVDDWNSRQRRVAIDSLIPRSTAAATMEIRTNGQGTGGGTKTHHQTLEQLATEVDDVDSPRPEMRPIVIDEDSPERRGQRRMSPKGSSAGNAAVTPRRSRSKVVLSRPSSTSRTTTPTGSTNNRRSSVVRL